MRATATSITALIMADLRSLEALVETATALLTQLQSALSEIHKDPSTASTASSANPLSLAHDSASLIRAHGTKISLLIINEPFTPSAIGTVIRELTAGPIPALVSAAQQCASAEYTAQLRKELAWRSQRVLVELHGPLAKIPKNGKVVPQADRSSGKGSLPATGLLWAACDDVLALSKMGVPGFFNHKIQQWADILTDVSEELKEWGDEEPEEDEDDVASVDSAQAALDNLMDAHGTIPATDPHKIRPRLESSLKRLRLATLLYQALGKRRIKKLPPFPTDKKDVPARLDEMASVLAKLPDRFGDLACAFYELQPDEIDAAMDQCFLDAFAAGELFIHNWDGERDDFSEWLERYQTEMKRVNS